MVNALWKGGGKACFCMPASNLRRQQSPQMLPSRPNCETESCVIGRLSARSNLQVLSILVIEIFSLVIEILLSPGDCPFAETCDAIMGCAAIHGLALQGLWSDEKNPSSLLPRFIPR